MEETGEVSLQWNHCHSAEANWKHGGMQAQYYQHFLIFQRKPQTTQFKKYLLIFFMLTANLKKKLTLCEPNRICLRVDLAHGPPFCMALALQGAQVHASLTAIPLLSHHTLPSMPRIPRG